MGTCPFASRIFQSESEQEPRDLHPGVGTVSWKLQREIVLLLAWGAAILLQFAHPLVASAIADHSTLRIERWGRRRRFHRTLDAMLQLCFGSEDEAGRSWRGSTRSTTGCRATSRKGAVSSSREQRIRLGIRRCWPGCTQRWLHEPQGLRTLRGDPLPGVKGSVLCRGQCDRATPRHPRGTPAEELPELHHYVDSMLVSEIAVTDTARTLAREIVYPPALRIAGPAIWLVRLPSIGSLPPRIREAYGFSWRPQDDRMLRLSARLVRNVLPLAPAVVRHWPAARTAAFRVRAAVESRSQLSH